MHFFSKNSIEISSIKWRNIITNVFYLLGVNFTSILIMFKHQISRETAQQNFVNNYWNNDFHDNNNWFFGKIIFKLFL